MVVRARLVLGHPGMHQQALEYDELDHAYLHVIELEQQLSQAIEDRRSDPGALERARTAADALLDALSPFVTRSDELLRSSFALAMEALDALDELEEREDREGIENRPC